MDKKKIVGVCSISALLMGILLPLGQVSNVENNNIVKNDNQVEEVNKSISASFPTDGESVHILKPNVLSYINAMHEQAKGITNDYIMHDFYVCSDTDASNYGVSYSNETDLVKIDDYYSSSINYGKSKGVSLVFNPSGFPDDTEYVVKYGLLNTLSDATEIKTKENYVSVYNLEANRTYYWQVSSGNVSSDVNSFVTDDGFKMVTASGISNIRDMGGRQVEGGKHIKQGLIFRGGEMVEETYVASGSSHYENLTAQNKAVMQDEIQIKYEIDLRGDDEANNITASPLLDETHTDVDYLRIPNMAAYDYFFKMSSSDARWGQIKDMFLAFKDAETKHVYFHCWGGADRTGTIGFLLGGLLGMSYTDLVIDFELTSFACNYRPHYLNDPKKVYRFPQLIYQMKNAVGSDGNKYYEENKSISDIIADVLMDKAGLTSQDISDIKSALLED